jgi:hypothetical protein
VVVSTARTVRPGWSAGALAALVAALVAGCSDDDGGGAAPASSTTTPAAPATLPEEVDPGRGFLLLDGEASVLTVASCELTPSTDPATGVTTELHAVATDAEARTVDVSRSSFTADVPTVTDTIAVADDTRVVAEASRADRDGLLIDLREPNPVGRLLDLDVATGTFRAAGVFGPAGGGPGDDNVDGELLLRCP